MKYDKAIVIGLEQTYDSRCYVTYEVVYTIGTRLIRDEIKVPSNIEDLPKIGQVLTLEIVSGASH